jgi:hypothetical protein
VDLKRKHYRSSPNHRTHVHCSTNETKHKGPENKPTLCKTNVDLDFVSQRAPKDPIIHVSLSEINSLGEGITNRVPNTKQRGG